MDTQFIFQKLYNMENENYIPALKYNWLTKIYNPLIAFTMPELKFKKSLIEQAKITTNHEVLDFGVGTATLSLLIKDVHKDAVVNGVDVDDKILKIAAQKIEIQSLIKQKTFINELVNDNLQMLNSEERLFSFGESSMFLINTRENNLVTAQLSQIVLENRFYISNSELFRIMANPD